MVRVSDVLKPAVVREYGLKAKDDTRRGREGQRAHKVLSGTWEIRRSTPPEVGGGHSSVEASNDRGAKGLYIGEAT